MKVSLLSLGCPKNQADSETLLAELKRAGVEYAGDPEDSDVMLVNTCGFIEDAKRESIEEILRLARLRGKGRRLLVYGCLAQRYREELLNELPEVDAVFGVAEEDAIISYLLGTVGSPGSQVADVLRPREYVGIFKEGACPSVAPLKVAEGCSRRCSFCAIPSIRGPFRSLRRKDILSDARALLDAGARELMLVAQDLTRYDLPLNTKQGGRYGLPGLLRDLAALEGDFWIRPMYLYPQGVSVELLEVVAGEGKICNYIDMPVQHSEDRILRLMRRRGSRDAYLKLIERIRRRVPGVAIRTSVIVGFPGEGEREFRGLMDFVREAEFDRLGVFAYSKEEGTPAAGMKGHVSRKVKQRRMDEIMGLQAGISLKSNRALLGRRMRAVVEDVLGGRAVGRIETQAPEVDGHTIIKGIGTNLRQGDFVGVRITGADVYDLEAEPCEG